MQRRLSLTDGKSDKFWYIDATENLVTVSYGRRGSRGTTSTKKYATAELALAEAEKQVAAKVKKGYTDEAGASTAALPPAPTSTTNTVASNQGPATTVASEPVSAPVMLTPTDAAADDLGLVVSPFERAYDLNCPVTIGVDTEPFDPDAELARANRIVSVETIHDPYVTLPRIVLREPLFRTLPSRERRDWWRHHLEALVARRYRSRGNPQEVWISAVPSWLYVVLATDWEAPTGQLVKQSSTYERTRPGGLQRHDIHLAVISGLDPALDISALVARPVLATLPAADLQQARDALPSPLPQPLTQTYRHWQLTDSTMYVAAALDALDPDEARAAFDSITDGNVTATHALILPTAAERAAFARRRGATIDSWKDVVPWLIGTGSHGFSVLLQSLNQPKEVADLWVRLVAEIAHGPGMTPFFLDVLSTKAAASAAEWLRTHIPQAVAANLSARQAAALAPTLRALSIDQLRDLAPHATSHTRAVIETLIAETTTPDLAADTPWWLAAAVDLPQPKPLPFDLASLPPLQVDGCRLSPGQLTTLFQALGAETQHPLVTAVRDRAVLVSRDRFATAVLHQWLAAGAPSRQSWLMTGAAWLGDTTFVHDLTPLIREWPGVNQHQRAVKGLTALRNVGTDTALQALSGIAAKIKFAALKKRAGEAMDEIAAHRGFSRDELEDRILGDGGLDPQGSRTFSYGARQFLVQLSSEGKLTARLLSPEGRPTGKLLTTLPAPNKSDDAALAQQARADFSNLKKSVTALAKTQIQRFEQAMITDRRWSLADHARYIAPHPVLRRLLAGLVWAVYNPAGQLVATAHIDEDGQLVGPDDESISVTDGTVGVAHPIDLSADQISRWAQILADYELTTAFRQLDRAVFTLPADQGDDTMLHDLPQAALAATKLVSAFTAYGWQRGNAYDNGIYCLHFLQIPTADLTIVVEYDGMWMGPITEVEDQKIEKVYALRGILSAHDLGWGIRDIGSPRLVPWNRVPAKITSEVLATVNHMAS